MDFITFILILAVQSLNSIYSLILANNPMSCKDYFSRVNQPVFNTLPPNACFMDITIDPLGPGNGDPEVAGVTCCKISNTEIRTTVSLF